MPKKPNNVRDGMVGDKEEVGIRVFLNRFMVLPVDNEVAEKAVQLRRRYRMRLLWMPSSGLRRYAHPPCWLHATPAIFLPSILACGCHIVCNKYPAYLFFQSPTYTPEIPAGTHADEGCTADHPHGGEGVGIPYSEESVTETVNQVEERIEMVYLLPERR